MIEKCTLFNRPHFNRPQKEPNCFKLRHVQGICEHLTRIMKEMHGVDVDPQTDIDPGDGVVLFDSSYETYESCIRMAGEIPVSLLLSINTVLRVLVSSDDCKRKSWKI